MSLMLWVGDPAESLRYLSLYDNRYLRYFKGHRDRSLSDDIIELLRSVIYTFSSSPLLQCKPFFVLRFSVSLLL
jgi:hypothetical protein